MAKAVTPSAYFADVSVDDGPLAGLVRELCSELARLAPATPPAGMDPDAAAAFIAMSRSSLDAYVAAGLVPAPAKVGGKRIYSRAMLSAWLDHGGPPAAEFELTWRKLLAAQTGRATK